MSAAAVVVVSFQVQDGQLVAAECTHRNGIRSVVAPKVEHALAYIRRALRAARVVTGGRR